MGAGSALLIVALLVFGLFAWIRSTRGSTRRDLELYKVKYDRVELSIVERGALESAKNSDIYCRVKARSQGSTVASQIKSVIDDGSEVVANRPLDDVRTVYYWDDKAGIYRSRPGRNPNSQHAVVEVPGGTGGETQYADLLVELDDSGLLEQLKTQKITVDKAESDKIQAEEAYKITVSQNDSDIKTAETQLELAIIALMKYTGLSRDDVLKPETLARLKEELKNAAANARRPAAELAEEDLKRYKSGDYLAQLKDLLGQIENSKSDLSQQEDREAWSYRMVKKGYQTSSQAQAETSRKESYQLTLNKVSLNLDVLVKYTKISDLTKYLTSDPSAAGKGGLEEQQRNLERTKFQSKSKEVKDKTDREAKKSVWEQEVSKYKEILDEIKKCKIYAPQDGMVVYYIPDQARWGGGSQQSIVAQGEPVREGQKLMQIPDLKQMLVNTKVHEALITKVHPGQPALIRIDSTSTQTLHGKVESVATVAAQADWMAADVKVYTTKVAIDPDEIEHYKLDLKPGMSAEVTILVADALEHVLTVPIQAIVGGSEMGPHRTIVVMTPDGPKEREIVVGASNEKVAEVKEGLKEGDEIVLNPKAVLGDKIKVHSGAADKTLVVPADQNGDSKSEGKNGKAGGREKGDRGGAGGRGPGGGPGAAEGGGGPGGGDRGPGGGGGGAGPTEEQRKQFQAWIDSMKKATPEERKKKIEELPAERREGAKAFLKSQGVEIPD
jgi:multidrug resistance efflux pump